MKAASRFELPEELRPVLRQARKLEWITLGYMLSVTAVMYLAMGNSQAMKAAWLEDALSILPATAFLIASAIYDKPPNKEFPYGYHRVFSIAFLVAAVALFSIGAFLLIDSALTLIKKEHPSIGAVVIDGKIFWLGYLMYAALLYSAVPAIVLGRKKLPLASRLHNKVLHTDAQTQKADWMTALAAVVGITGTGFGWWWTDPVAAIFISASVLHDGFKSLKNAAEDLVNRRPKNTQQTKPDPLLEKIETFLQTQEWINASAFRFREDGQIYFGEVFVVPKTGDKLSDNIERLEKDLQNLHWKIREVAVMPVKELPRGENK